MAVATDVECGRAFSPVAVRCGGGTGIITLSEMGDLVYTPHPRIRSSELLGASLEPSGGLTVWYAREYSTRTGCVEKKRYRVHSTRRFQAADPAAAASLVHHIRSAHSWWGRAAPPHVAAIVNPVSGRGAARRLLDSRLLPLLRDACGLRVSVHVTAAPMHAAELVRELRLTAGGQRPEAQEEAKTQAAEHEEQQGGDGSVDLVMFVGGDGTMYEGLQGLFQRPDWSAARAVPLVPVPCGSGNGLAASAGLWDADTAAVAICRGRTEPVDVASVLQPPGNRFYCLLSVVYGSMANLDIGTEHLSAAASLRGGGSAAVGGAGAGLTSPSGVQLAIPLLPEAPGDGQGASPSAMTHGSAAAASRGAGAATGGSPEERLLPAGAGAKGSCAARHHGAGGTGAQLSDYPEGPPLPLLSELASLPSPLPDSPATLPPGWRQLPDSYAIFGAYNTQYLALGARANPGGYMGDGAWEVWQLDPGNGPEAVGIDGRGGSGGGGAGRDRGGRAGGRKRVARGVRLRALKVLLGIEDGSFAQGGGVMEVTQARAMMFEQRDSATWTVLDGERVPDRPLFLEVHPGLCRMLVSPHFREEGL
ncbi:hypothetical protein GPECTOR_13g734 [Gonium pectorale]|uniref:DAGKc domain-containing protein n=1 Tax=Gonium pectorale TaxID=33097 RepID=A0A150GN55_GONPE|nr:hypothetical protein GPECTOR_13g734 [Gonium pectorale]|eukprot:KXZ51247.1 hypothetical protein GPECTOR_13g734 [Gonium pectorale]